jgi:uncharacterized damage-inducible protein DinB
MKTDLAGSVLAAWTTSNRVTTYLVEQIPAKLWSAAVPGIPSRTIREIAAHLHNARCRWIKTLGAEQGITVPTRVDQRAVTRKQVVAALTKSSRGMVALLRLACRSGTLPLPKAYTWRNLALDVGHVLTYFVAHDAHHRGQIVMAARQLNHRFSDKVDGALWRWRPRKGD